MMQPDEILARIGELRARNRTLYATAEAIFNQDKTLALTTFMYAYNKELAKPWHREVLGNDREISELTGMLCK